MRPSLRHLPSLSAGLLLLTLSGTPALAQCVPDQSLLTSTQKQKLLPGMRTLSLQATQTRIGILQTTQKCLSAANSMDAIKTCQQQERQASMDQRKQCRQGMKQLFESNGIAMPQRQPQSRNNI